MKFTVHDPPLSPQDKGFGYLNDGSAYQTLKVRPEWIIELAEVLKAEMANVPNV